jgi:hypothetical protein
LITYRGYDKDGLREQLRPIVRHRKGRRKPATQDGRSLQRHKQRWVIICTTAWLGNYQRSTVRYGRVPTIYRRFFHIACFMIVLRRFLEIATRNGG